LQEKVNKQGLSDMTDEETEQFIALPRTIIANLEKINVDRN